MNKIRSRGIGLERFSGLYLAGLLIVVFGLWEPSTFLTAVTLHSVAANQAVSGLVAVAVLIPLATGTYDLTVGATANLTAVLVVTLQVKEHWSIGPAIIAGVATGAFIGFVNGFIVVALKVNSFIATLGMATVISAVQQIVSNGNQPFPPTAAAWTDLTNRDVFGFQIIVVYLLVVAVFFWWLLEHTPAGRYLYAIGGNSDAARLSGVAVGKWTWLSLITSGTLCGLAGIFYASLIGPSLTFGNALLLPAFAAVFLGSTQIRPGRPNIWGTVLALYLLAIGVKGLQLSTGVQWLNDMFSGLALVVAVSFAGWRQRGARIPGRRRGKASPRGGSPEAGGVKDTEGAHALLSSVKRA